MIIFIRCTLNEVYSSMISKISIFTGFAQKHIELGDDRIIHLIYYIITIQKYLKVRELYVLFECIKAKYKYLCYFPNILHYKYNYGK